MQQSGAYPGPLGASAPRVTKGAPQKEEKRKKRERKRKRGKKKEKKEEKDKST